MACTRCDGFLVPDEFVDLLEMTGPMEFQGVRCLNCGYIGDAKILANRPKSLPSHLKQSVTTGRGWMRETVVARAGSRALGPKTSTDL